MGNLKRIINLRNLGIINIVSPIPMYLATGMWCLYICVGLGVGILGYTTMPGWIVIAGTFPILLSPAFQVFGVIYGITRRKEAHAARCVILSLLGLLINIAFLSFMSYFSSIA